LQDYYRGGERAAAPLPASLATVTLPPIMRASFTPSYDQNSTFRILEHGREARFLVAGETARGAAKSSRRVTHLGTRLHVPGPLAKLYTPPPVPLLTGGLRRRLPRNEFPALRRFCPGVEEHEPQAARLAVDLCLDRRTPGDESGVARNAHLAIATDRA